MAKTAIQFLHDVAGAMGWEKPASVTATDKEAVAMMDAVSSVMEAVSGDQAWPTLTVQAVLSLDATVLHEDVTVTVVRGNTALGAVGASFVAGDVGKVLYVSGSNVSYRITAVGDAENITLDRAWSEADIVADTRTAYVGQDRYLLPLDFDRMLNEHFDFPVDASTVDLVGPQELSIQRKLNGISFYNGPPSKASIYGLDATTGRKYVQLDSCPDDSYDLPYAYQKAYPDITDSSDPILYPDRHLMYLQDMVVARLKRDHEAANNAAQHWQDAVYEENKASRVQESGSDRPRIKPQSRLYGSYRTRFRR